MQNTNDPQANRNAPVKPELPKMVKPVSGEFKKNRKKLVSIVKTSVQARKAKGKQ